VIRSLAARLVWVAAPIVVGFLVVAHPSDVTALLLAALLCLIGVAITRAAEDGEALMVRTFLLAFAVRIVAVYLLYGLLTVHHSTLFVGDDVQYDREAALVQLYWHGKTALHPTIGFGSDWNYPWINAVILQFSPSFLLLPRVVNAFAGALAAAFAASASRRLFGSERAGRATGLLAALLPSYVIWSSLNLREAWIWLGVSLLAYAVSRFPEVGVRSVSRVVLLAFAILAAFRPWAFFVLIAGLALGLLLAFPRGRARAASALALIAVSALVFGSLGATTSLFHALGERSLPEIHNTFAIGGSALQPVRDFGNGGTALSYAPQTLVYVVLGPFPGSVRGLRGLFSVPEVLVWYSLLPFVLMGLGRGLRSRPTSGWPLVGMAGGLIVAISLVEANGGLIYRHRLMAFLVLLIFAGGGWERFRSKREITA